MQTRAATFFVRTRPRLPNHDGWHSLPRCPGTFLRAERETSSPYVGSEACLGGAPPAFVADSSVGVGVRERLGLLVLDGRGGRCQCRLRTRGGGGERGDGARCGVPLDGGRAGKGEGRHVVARMFFQHGMFCVGFRCCFITRPSPVRCGVWGGGRGAWGSVGCVGWYGRELSLCRDTVFNLAEGPLRERFFPCTHGFPRCPPHADARSWARHRSVGKGCAGGVGGAVQCAECGSG